MKASATGTVSVSTPGRDNFLSFLPENFEGTAFPPPGWTSQGSGSAIWTRSTSASGYGSGTGSALADFYNIQSGSFSLVSPTFTNAVAGDSLRFDHAYATYQTENDQLQISTSVDGGTTWATLVTLSGGVSGTLVTAPPTQNVFVPTASQWATKKYSLPAGVNRVKFTGISAFGNCLYVDNIVIGTPFNNDVAATTINAPGSHIFPGIYAPGVAVTNYGLNAESFPVTLTITPGGYTSTQNVTALVAGASQQLAFMDWTPGIGSYTITAITQLGTDENRSNDTVSSFHIVSDIQRAVVLEFATGAWCQWCPCGDSTAERLLRTYPNLVVLAYHGPAGYTGDPWTNYSGNVILGLLAFPGYPTAIVDRQNGPGDYTTWTEYCQNRYDSNAPTAITINVLGKTYNPTTRELDVTLGFTSNCNLPFSCNASYVISEDGLLAAQTGNTTCPGSPGWVHNWVVRSMVNGATGEALNSGTWTAGQTFTRTLSTTISSDWTASNCKLNVFVYRDSPVLSGAEIQNAMTVPVLPESTLYSVSTNWNLLSLPLTVANPVRAVVFPPAISSAFAFDQNSGYVVRDTLRYGEGFWLKFPSSQNISITGTARLQDSIAVRAGWNLIGAISSPVPTGSIVQIPSGIVASSYYGYNGAYAVADTLFPGKGYWIKVSGTGHLVLH